MTTLRQVGVLIFTAGFLCYSSVESIPRDSRGRIKRNPAARKEFQLQNPCPSTGRTKGSCPGYVIDHIKALKRGGCDEPRNMQWQTIQEAKEKDKWE